MNSEPKRSFLNSIQIPDHIFTERFWNIRNMQKDFVRIPNRKQTNNRILIIKIHNKGLMNQCHHLLANNRDNLYFYVLNKMKMCVKKHFWSKTSVILSSISNNIAEIEDAQIVRERMNAFFLDTTSNSYNILTNDPQIVATRCIVRWLFPSYISSQ